MEQKEYQTLILAGLLHDVGKLLNKPAPVPHKSHAEYGCEFLQESEVASELRAERFREDIDYDALCEMVLYHDPHVLKRGERKVRAGLLRIMRRADGYSAGERALGRLYGQPATGDLPLDSIYTQRDLGRPLPDSRPFYKPRVLSPGDAFPDTGVQSLTVDDYEPLQESFKAAYRYALGQAQDWAELEAWTYSLLERYTWAVPSALHKDPRDVSLFDHARTSCAIAAAVYLRHASERADRKRKLFLLVKGDVSGVQDYIYSVANVGPGGVAKRLRARSFFVTALTEVVAHRLRDELVDGQRLPIAATIFAGGGQFVLLAPNLKSVAANLKRIEKEVNKWLWTEFQGDLAFVFGAEEVGGTELAIKPRKKGRNICQVLGELERKVEEAKKQRLGALLQKGGRWEPEFFVWAPEEKDYEHGACPSCDRLPARADEEEENIDERLCERCYKDRLLSERIVDAHYVGYWRGDLGYEGDPDWLKRRHLEFFDRDGKGDRRRHVVLLSDLSEWSRFRDWPYQLDGFGYEVPTEKRPEAGVLPLVRHFANHVPRFKTKAELEKFCTPERACVEVSFEGDNACGILVRPDPEGSEVKPGDFPILRTFGCISAAAAEWVDEEGEGEREKKLFYGSQLLGVLRADVDHLGKLFTKSLVEEVRLSKEADPKKLPVKSLSRLATLSRMTDLFFSGWVNEMLEDPPKGKRFDLIYTVYSGGDDLCLVGPWDVVIDFARHLAKEFERYVAGNPNVTLSAAISVTKPKFPIATSARKAGGLLKAAKNKGRNRFNLFGVITRWSEEPDKWVGLSRGLKDQLDKQQEHAMLPLEDLWRWADLLDTELCRWREAKKEGRRYPVSTGFTHRLLGHAEMAQSWKESGEISNEDLIYLARLAYDLGRNVVESEEVSEKTKRELTKLTQLESSKVMAGMRLAITYALYRNRERSRER